MAKNAKRPAFDPDTLREIAAFLTRPADPDAAPRDPQADLKEAAGRLSRLVALAETNPPAWRILIQFIGEHVQRRLAELASVDPAADPVALHGSRCYTSGGATALTDLARELLPENLRARLDKVVRACDNDRED